MSALSFDLEVYTQSSPCSDHCSSHHIRRIAIFKIHRFRDVLPVLLFCFVDCPRQLRRCSDNVLCVDICDIAGLDDGPVLVGYLCPAWYVADLCVAAAEQRQGWREQEELDAMITVKAHDLCQDRKRRVVDHDVPVLVVLFLVVSAWIEWPDELLPVELVLIGYPCRDGLINDVRRIAVVGRLLWLKLVQELVVFVVAFLAAGVVAVLALEPGRRLGKIKAGQADVEVEVVQL